MEGTQQTPPQDGAQGNAGMKMAIGALVVAGVAGAGYYFIQNNKAAAPTSTTPETSVNTTPTPATETPTYLYKNGTYSATGSYNSPAGKETVDVSITLQNDAITAATFKGNAVNPASKFNQDKFSKGFESVVVGKPIDSLSLTVVNGASLTPKGFMDAVVKIKAEAKV